MAMLTDKIAVITGAARGQGAAEARLFVTEGAEVVICDLLEAEGKALADELGPRARFIRLDVTDPASWQALGAQLEQAFGRLDILVNNAAIYRRTEIAGADLADFDASYAVNQRGVFLGIRMAAPLMRKAGGGSIVNIASASGLKATIGYSAYVATKFAVRGLTKVAALELGADNIRVNAVLPGFVDTPMIADVMRRNSAQEQIARLPARRAGQPEDIAQMVCFLASDQSSYCTGADFICDGGLLTGTLPPKEG